MKKVTVCFLWIVLIYLLPRDVYAQTAGKRDSTVADSLVKLKPWLNGWRLTTLNRAVTTLQTPHPVVAGRVDTVIKTVRLTDTLRLTDTVFVRDSAITPPPPLNQPPVVSFTFTKNDSTRLVRVVNQSSDPEGGAVTYRWTWSDGAVSSAVSPSHTFAGYGVVGVTVTATDPKGAASTLTRSITLVPVVTNAAPMAKATGNCVDATLVCTVNGALSTDDKGVASGRIVWGDGAVTNAITSAHTFAQPGTYNATFTAIDAEGLSSTAQVTLTLSAPVVVQDSTISIATIAELPRATPSFTVPPVTRSTVVTAGMDLQAAINAAQPAVGEHYELRLSGVYTGNFVLPTRPCGSWVTIRSNAADSLLPRPGERPTARHYPYMPAIRTDNASPALKTRNPTCGWRLIGLDISATANAGVVGSTLNYGILWIGDGGWLGGGETVRSVATQPRDIIIDRVYLHGAPTTNTTRCLYLNAGAAVVRDSWLSDCHAVGFDAQAILLCNGTGPTLIENNYLAGAAENFMAGGCDPVDATLIPSDITVRRNHFDKPTSWKSQGWLIKNGFELKNARRVLVEANVFDACTWTSAQVGMCWVLKSSTETCAACTWEGTKDVTMRFNITRYSHRGLNIQAIDASSAGSTASHTERIHVYGNLFEKVGASNGVPPSDGWLMLLTHDLKDIRITRNTFLGNAPGYGLAAYLAYCGGAQMQRIDITDNVFAGQSYYAIASDASANHTAALTACAGSAWRFSGNAVSQIDGQFQGLYPTGNILVDQVGKLGLAADGSLGATSPAKSRATDGTDPGANIADVLKRTTGVVVAP